MDGSGVKWMGVDTIILTPHSRGVRKLRYPKKVDDSMSTGLLFLAFFFFFLFFIHTHSFERRVR